jgi:catalase
VPAAIIERQIALFRQVDPAYGAGVAEAVRRATATAPSQAAE